jgi:hypothetical protein
MVFYRLKKKFMNPFNTRVLRVLLAGLIGGASFLAANSAGANPYLAKPGEPVATIYVATCADAPIKSMRNHYGVRVTTNAEVDRATLVVANLQHRFVAKPILSHE